VRIDGVWRVTVGVAAFGTLLAGLSACGGGSGSGSDRAGGAAGPAARTSHTPQADPTRIPDVGDRLYRRIPADSRQVVVAVGASRNSAQSRVVLYTRRGTRWHAANSWPAHNGRRGWTIDHHEGDKRSPVGVFTLSDAGGVLPDPGTRLPYDHNAAGYAPPSSWAASHQHDFDYVIAIDYNRVRGTAPLDGTRPLGQDKGGGIWLHMDHGSGTSACVSVSKKAMQYLLRTLDPARHPVIVMGDRADLDA
jgi:L,D-peptidoglycan transpeptidase YkuD (ErfK/YbiS/YcfS/YnhG family)